MKVVLQFRCNSDVFEGAAKHSVYLLCHLGWKAAQLLLNTSGKGHPPLSHLLARLETGPRVSLWFQYLVSVVFPNSDT